MQKFTKTTLSKEQKEELLSIKEDIQNSTSENYLNIFQKLEIFVSRFYGESSNFRKELKWLSNMSLLERLKSDEPSFFKDKSDKLIDLINKYMK